MRSMSKTCINTHFATFLPAQTGADFVTDYGICYRGLYQKLLPKSLSWSAIAQLYDFSRI